MTIITKMSLLSLRKSHPRPRPLFRLPWDNHIARIVARIIIFNPLRLVDLVVVSLMKIFTLALAARRSQTCQILLLYLNVGSILDGMLVNLDMISR